VGQRGVDRRIAHRADWLCLAGNGASGAEPIDQRESLGDGCGNQLLTAEPAEHSLYPADVLIDRTAGQAGVDHSRPDGFEGNR